MPVPVLPRSNPLSSNEIDLSGRIIRPWQVIPMDGRLVENFTQRAILTSNPPHTFFGVPWRDCSSYLASSGYAKHSNGSAQFVWPSGETVNAGSYEGQNPNRSFNIGASIILGPYVEPGSLYPSEISLNRMNRLSTELMLKVGARKVSYGESLGESRQTANHLFKTVNSAVKALLAARKGNFREVAKQLGVRNRQFFTGKSAADRWLEYQYGWMPLLSDIYDTSELLKKGFREKAQIMSSVRQLTDNHHFDGTSWSGIYSSTNGSSKRVDRMKVYYKVDDTWLSRIHQMGLINPAEVAWALVPFSFVVDWFLPVGNFLEALTARCGTTFVDGTVSTKVTTDTVNRANTDVVNSWIYPCTVLSSNITSNASYSGYRRQKLHSFPTPMPYIKSPLSTSHGLSALALLRQLK